MPKASFKYYLKTTLVHLKFVFIWVVSIGIIGKNSFCYHLITSTVLTKIRVVSYIMLLYSVVHSSKNAAGKKRSKFFETQKSAFYAKTHTWSCPCSNEFFTTFHTPYFVSSATALKYVPAQWVDYVEHPSPSEFFYKSHYAQSMISIFYKIANQH